MFCWHGRKTRERSTSQRESRNLIIFIFEDDASVIERAFHSRTHPHIHLTVLVEISRRLLAEFAGSNKYSSRCLPRSSQFYLIKLFVDVFLIRNLQGNKNLSSAFALEAVDESDRVSSNSSVESEMAQRTRSTGIIEIRSPELENLLSMPAT